MDHPLIQKVVTPFGDFYAAKRPLEKGDVVFKIDFPRPLEEIPGRWGHAPSRIQVTVRMDLCNPVEGHSCSYGVAAEFEKVPMNGASTTEQREARYENARRKLIAKFTDDLIEIWFERAFSHVKRQFNSALCSLNSKVRNNLDAVWVRQAVDDEWFGENSLDLIKANAALKGVREEMRELRLREGRLVSQITEAKRRMIEEALKNTADEVADQAFKDEIRALMKKPVQAGSQTFF